MKANKHFNVGKIILNTENRQPLKSIYDIELVTATGGFTSLAAYKKRKILLVNTASACGYTPQYAQLEEMHQQMNDRVQIIAIPSNDFGAQEPGTNEEIAAFCEANYGVTFPVMGKINVTGEHMHPLYNWLTQPYQNGWNSHPAEWNFCKYLISETGVLLAFYSQHVEPGSDDILKAIAT